MAPDRILAVTFTRKAADEMRRRISALLELHDAAGLDIMTFHAFAYRLLRRNPAIAGLGERMVLWNDAEQRRVFTTRRMFWNEDDDILDIIGGAKERLLDARAFAASIDATDDVLVEAANTSKCMRKRCARPAQSTSPTWCRSWLTRWRVTSPTVKPSLAPKITCLSTSIRTSIPNS